MIGQQDWLKKHTTEFGRREIFSLVVVGLSAAFYTLILRPMQTELSAAQHKLESAEKMQMEAHRKTSGASLNNAKLGRFYHFFKRKEHITNWLERIYALARKDGLDLPTGKYQTVSDDDSALLAYQIDFPVSGSYGQIRAFTAAALDAIPTLSLDQITLHRKTIADTRVDAEIRFTLYLPKS